MGKKFKTVAVAGTFDNLHKGHRELLLKALQIGEHIIIGVSSDKFVSEMNKPHKTASYEKRVRELRQLLRHLTVLQRTEVVPIDDAYGGVLLSKGPIEALVVSKDTQRVALMINQKRKEIGITPLKIVIIKMISSEDHEAISTTRIRRREIDREGHVLRK